MDLAGIALRDSRRSHRSTDPRSNAPGPCPGARVRLHFAPHLPDRNVSKEQILGGGVLWTLLIAFLAGLLARALKPGDDKLGLFMTIVLGILGALLARFIGDALGWYSPGEPTGFIASVIGAIVLLLIYGMVRKKK